MIIPENLSCDELKQRLKALEKADSERKRAVEALRESKLRFRRLVESSSGWIWELNVNGVYTDASPKVEEILGYSPMEVIGKTPLELMPPEEAAQLVGIFQDLLAKGEPIVALENVNLHKDGRRIILETSGFPIYNEAGTITGYQGVNRDITERRRSKEALCESEGYLQSVFRAAPTGIGVVVDRVLQQVNKRMCEMTGYAEEELTGRNARILYASDEDYEYVGQEKYAQIRDNFTGTVETLWKRKDGQIINVLLSSTPMAVSDLSKGVTFTALDITHRKQAEAEQVRLQAQLMQAQKMEAIGTLAGGIAHNFNNVLMAIQGRISLMLMDKEDLHPDFEHLKSIQDYIKNAAGLTKNLLGFARGGKYELSPTNLNNFIAHENHMFVQTKKEIRIHGKYAADLWSAEIDHGQMKQVLMNLYLNAWQAMPEGGEIYVQTENATLDADYVNSFKVAPGRYVKISITDTGVGMDEVTREKIFVPFFTTQEIGAGFGLGLASVYGIIKNHGGFINVYSKKGEGTSFNIFLPASDKTVIDENTQPDEIVKGEETILLVDDEEMITEVNARLLKRLGYSVLVAGSGEEAVEIFEKKYSDIDLVILDMIMPGMGGRETYDRLKKISPVNKILLASGYAFDFRAQELLDRGCDGFIHKPFNIKEISLKIREVLNKSKADK
jgi:PAS domain S-box-containing protein